MIFYTVISDNTSIIGPMNITNVQNTIFVIEVQSKRKSQIRPMN